MQAFADLIERLDRSAGTGERVELLSSYFAAVAPVDAAWALQVLLAKRRRRLITGRRLRQICLEDSGLPEWLFDACHAQVGDSAETIALLWPGEAGMEGVGRSGSVGAAAAIHPAPGEDRALKVETNRKRPAIDGREPSPSAEAPLHHWMEQLLPAAAALEGEEQAQAVRKLWQGLDAQQLLVACKLLTGGLRVGVAQGLVVRALARLSGLEEALLQHRLMGTFTPSPEAWNALLAPAEDGQAVASRPYPFFLASPLERDPAADAPLPGTASDWLVEWKWDGIRGQLIHRPGGSFLWSRGEELIHEAFPELLEAAACLPPGTVLDGEVLVWPPGEPRPAPFAQLQRRLGRKRPGRSLLAECPAVLVAYDLLETHGEDIRGWPLSRRRAALEALLREALQATPGPAAGVLNPGGPPAEAVVMGPDGEAGAAFHNVAVSPQAGADADPVADRPSPLAIAPVPQPQAVADPVGGFPSAAAALTPPKSGGKLKSVRSLSEHDPFMDARWQPLHPAAGGSEPSARLRLSPARPLASWEDLEQLRQAAAEVNAEGLMLKALDSPYRAGRRRGTWWKHKREPYHLDAVLLYAQAGSGRRANLFTDYTFGLWERPLDPQELAAEVASGSIDPAAAAPMPVEARVEPGGESSDDGTPSQAPPRRLVSFAKAYSGLDDGEILALDRWIRGHTTERFGPVRAVQPLQVFELAFEGLQRSGRHKSGIAVRFPRISRWRRDKPAAEADTLEAALALLARGGGAVEAPR